MILQSFCNLSSKLQLSPSIGSSINSVLDFICSHRLTDRQFTELQGDSANAVPHYQKLCARVTHIWGNRRGQPNRSAMERSHPRGTTFVIMVNLCAR